MIKNITAGTLLNSLVVSLLIGVTGLGAFAYYLNMQSAQRSAAGQQLGHDFGTAAAAARAADRAAHTQDATLRELATRDAKVGVSTVQRDNLKSLQKTIRTELDVAAQALQRQGVETSTLDAASALQNRLEQQADALLQAGRPTAALAGGSKWVDIGANVEAATQFHAAAVSDMQTTQARLMGWVLIALVAIGFALALRLRKMILRFNGRPLRIATQLIEQVAAGDLTIKAEGMDQAHTRRLAEALDSMAQNLRTVITDVAERARSVADTSAQIAQGNLDLSQRTEEQASTLEETASSMEELTSTVANNADNARQASLLAASASETAEKGSDVVEEVVKTMDEILDASKRISDIISVIDGIAFQTNILALNAAVEAARAGDQGRGFAVVATEVRTLAHRTTAAAKEIKSLIAHSERKVQAGSSRVDEAGHTMVGVVLSVKKVSGLIAEIAAASQEQSAGIGQVNTAVSQMEQVVQQNASLVEEASAATESMKDQAAALLHAMSRFKLSNDAGHDDDDGAEGAGPQTTPEAAVNPRAPLRAKSKAIAAMMPPVAARSEGRKSTAPSGKWEDY